MSAPDLTVSAGSGEPVPPAENAVEAEGSGEPAELPARLIDREALARLEPAAVDAFVRETIHHVHSLLYRMLSHKEEVEDLVQDVYIRAWKALPAYRGDASPMTWLYRIAINAGRDAIARRQVDRKRTVSEPDDVIELRPAAHDPQRDMLTREENAALEAAIAELPEDRREIILLADIEGMSMEEIARVLDAPQGTVKSRLHRARETLRELVKRRLGTWP